MSRSATTAVPNRQRIWEAIRALHADGQPITARDVWAGMPDTMPRTRVDDYIRSLVAGGYLRCRNPERRRGVAAEYALVRDVGVEAPRVRRDGTQPPTPGREQLWRTLKIVGDFTATELADAASTPTTPIAQATAAEYCHFLKGAGYLQVTRPGAPGVAERYRLIPSRWTGPQAPMIQRTKRLFDPNTGQVVFERVTKTEGGEP
ncbi:hypothetical protein [Modicisalibacter sp. MOD 31.J]|uniref:hypothetical protein n=1 Tax=Modicisalibacter sp. MOD 31.J TaxID=2831897 RepID=UPI001CC96563|nr:hypothetical protein [Modicisalibacter sp. MOD 31.J]MBZ9574386.1 hypothetical protein [Modicisalibacter sp. MOD 31.J]